MAQGHPPTPLDFDARDVTFARDMSLWSLQMQCDIRELLAATRQTIATSRSLMAEADRILASFGRPAARRHISRPD